MHTRTTPERPNVHHAALPLGLARAIAIAPLLAGLAASSHASTGLGLGDALSAGDLPLRVSLASVYANSAPAAAPSTNSTPATGATSSNSPNAPGAPSAPAAATPPPTELVALRDTYLLADGRWYFGVNLGVANNFKSNTDTRAGVSFSTFPGERLEVVFDFNAWYFAQSGKDTGGGSVGLTFRYHFWADEDRDWTVFGQTGVGVLLTGRAVPDGGTNVNFLPHVGAGFTKRLTPDGVRLVAGFGWHHISNANIRGDSRNPARDGLLGFVGVVFPF
jgi:hypothetical protein